MTVLARMEAWFLGCDGQTDRQRDKDTDIATYRLNRPKGRFSENLSFEFLYVNLINYSQTSWHLNPYIGMA